MKPMCIYHAFMNSTMGIIIISLLLFHKTCLFTPDIESNMPKFRIGAYFLLESMKYSNIQPYAYLHISRYIWSRLSGHGRPDHVVWMTPKRPRSGGESWLRLGASGRANPAGPDSAYTVTPVDAVTPVATVTTVDTVHPVDAVDAMPAVAPVTCHVCTPSRDLELWLGHDLFYLPLIREGLVQ